jgi:hypothetical protein
MIEIKEHIDKNTLHLYKNLQLSPVELLNVDDHLSVCEYCRLQIQQTPALDGLYQSLFQNEPSENKFGWFNFNLTNRFNFSGKLKKLAFASVLTSLLILFFSILFWNQKLSEKQVAVINQTEQTKLNESKQKIVQVEDNEKTFGNQREPIKLPTTLYKSAVTNKKAINSKKINLLKQVATEKRKEKKDNNLGLNLNLSELETDSSQTIGSDIKTLPNNKPVLKITKSKDSFFVHVKTNKKVSYCQYFLSEMPKLITVSKETRTNGTWQIPHKKLKTGRSYVLQITVVTEDNQTALIQKELKISSETLKNKTQKAGNKNGNKK